MVNPLLVSARRLVSEAMMSFPHGLGQRGLLPIAREDTNRRRPRHSLLDTGHADLDRGVLSLGPEGCATLALQGERAARADGGGGENSFLCLAGNRARPAALHVDKANS